MLRDLVKWAASLPEYPLPDNDNKVHPNYSSFYQKGHRFFQKLRDRFRPNMQSIFYFKQLLDQVVKERMARGFEGNFIEKLSLSADSEVILFGDCFGAFHSLIRDVEELHRQGLIDEELKLVRSNTYLVFNGNLINSAPYNIETLTAVLILLSRNPAQVFYIRGSHETEEEWHNFSFKQELAAQARKISKGLIPLNEEVNAFFDTLPLALYLKVCSPRETQFVRISHSADLDEADFSTFLLQDEEKADIILPLQNLTFPKVPLFPKFFFNGIDRSFSYRATTGFEFVTLRHETIICSLFSAPTRGSQEMYGFYNDSFAILKLQNWALHHYTQDVRQLQGFHVEVHNLEQLNYVGLASGKNRILLGCTLDLSKSSSLLGFRLKEGISLAATECNHLGGVNTQFLSPLFLDDGYTPYKALQNVEEFINLHHTDLIFTPLGTPTTEAFLPLAKAKQILILFPCTGASIFRQKELDHIVHLRSSYTSETKALIDYGVSKFRVRKFALFYQDDAYGLAGLEGAKQAFAHHGITHWLEVPYLRHSPNIQAAAQSIREFNAESILFISTYAPSVSLVNALTAAHLSNKVLMGISFLTDLFRDFLKTKGLSFIISRVLPNTAQSDLEIVAKYQKAMQTYNKSSMYSPDSFEGYVNVLFFTEVLKALTPPITKEKIIQQIAQYKNYSFFGLPLHFDPDTHTLCHKIWVDTGAQDWIDSD